MYYYARELFDAHRFEDAAAEFRKFLDGGKGWHADCVEACVLLSQCYERLGERSMQLNALLDSMYYDNPRARVLCEIGRWFMAEARFGQAAFWYEQALVSSKPEHGFFYAEEYGYIPHIQLCVCHYRLGDKARAIEHNEQAALCRPDSPAVAYNREYFSQAS